MFYWLGAMCFFVLGVFIMKLINKKQKWDKGDTQFRVLILGFVSIMWPGAIPVAILVAIWYIAVRYIYD